MSTDENDGDFVYLVLYKFKSEPVAARGAEYDDDLDDERPAVGRKRKRTSTKRFRRFNETVRKSRSARELRLKLPFDHFFHSITTNPLGWMAHVGRCILGVSGKVKDPNPDQEEWEAGTRFIFTPDDPFERSYTGLTNAADIAAIARRTQSVTQTSVRNEFSERLLARDGGCVFTNMSQLIVGAHLIPFARQNTWLKEIDKRRGTNVLDINGPQNGLTLFCGTHLAINQRDAAILNLPSPDLEVTDVAEDDTDTRSGRRRPQGRRIVFQWLTSQSGEVLHRVTPHNRDAIFEELSPLPSPELLDYVYGASVLSRLGEVTQGYQQYQRLQALRRPGPGAPKQREFTPCTSAEASHERGSDDSLGEGRNGGGPGVGHGGGSGLVQRGRSQRSRKSASGARRKAAQGQGHGDCQEPDSDGRVWRKLTDDEVDNWMALFRVDDDMLREFQEEEEHRAPHSIRNWSSQVSVGLPA